MKIEIKTTGYHLTALSNLFNSIHADQVPTTKSQKIAYSILKQVSASIRKKAVVYSDDMFSVTKKITLKLEYYEACYLEEFLNHALKSAWCGVDFHSIRNLRDAINQKLA